MELKDVVIEYLKDSKKTLSLVNLFNILLVKNLIPHKDRNILEIGHLKEICTSLAKEGVLIEKSPGKFAYNSDYKGEIKREATKTTKELKDVVIEYLKESKKTLSLVDLFNILLVKNLIPSKDKANLEIGHIKEICTALANEGVLVEKSPGKFAYNNDSKKEATVAVIEPEPPSQSAPSSQPALLPQSALSPQPAPLSQSAPSPQPAPLSQSAPSPQSAPSLQPTPSPQPAPQAEEPNALDMMWKYAEHKTNKKLEADAMFKFFAEENNKGDLTKIIDDFIDYFKIEKNKENLAKWEQHFSNALVIQGVISKWD